MYSSLFQKQKKNSAQIKATSVKERIAKLKSLRVAIQENLGALHLALAQDLRKSQVEADLTEVFPTFLEIESAIKNLKAWMAPHRVQSPLALFGSRSEIRYEPKGVVLIIGPWNYPFYLMTAPLVSAIAAGNVAILKPSEMSSHTSRFLFSLISKLFDESEVACVEGGLKESQELLRLPFDHIFFTGSPHVGKVIMAAAAINLTSVTLELGGKSPVIIEKSADLSMAANRVVWGKFLNAGQTCIAPDLVFVPEELGAEFTEEAKKVIQKFFGQTEEDRAKTPDLCRIINKGHYLRIKALVEGAIQSGAKLEMGGIFKEDENYIAPTLLTQIQPQLSNPEKPGPAILQEEIFGPVLPIIAYQSLVEVYDFLNEKPLALYIFSRNQDAIEEILSHTTAGGTTINSTMVHITNPYLPFGGVGNSGTGSYHGFFGFKAFSHERGVCIQGTPFSIQIFFPPYSNRITKWVKLLLKFFT